MAKSKTISVKIPMSLMGKIICALECVEPNLDEHGPNLVEDHDCIVRVLKNLQQSIDLRDSYNRFLKDSWHDLRWAEHMEYLQYKRDDAELPF